MSDQTNPTRPRSAEEDLALIRQMMAVGRRRAGVNGSHLVWWGALLSSAFFLQYASVVDWIPKYGATIWISMMVIGWAGSFYIGCKSGRSHLEHNPVFKAYGAAWLAVGITMLVHMIASFAGDGTSPTGSTTLAGGVIGSAFFVMSQVLRIRPMLYAAFGWWAIMAYAIYATSFPKEILLILSAASAFLIMAPGLYLSRLAANGE